MKARFEIEVPTSCSGCYFISHNSYCENNGGICILADCFDYSDTSVPAEIIFTERATFCPLTIEGDGEDNNAQA